MTGKAPSSSGSETANMPISFHFVLPKEKPMVDKLKRWHKSAIDKWVTLRGAIPEPWSKKRHEHQLKLNEYKRIIFDELLSEGACDARGAVETRGEVDEDAYLAACKEIEGHLKPDIPVETPYGALEMTDISRFIYPILAGEEKDFTKTWTLSDGAIIHVEQKSPKDVSRVKLESLGPTDYPEKTLPLIEDMLNDEKSFVLIAPNGQEIGFRIEKKLSAHEEVEGGKSCCSYSDGRGSAGTAFYLIYPPQKEHAFVFASFCGMH